MATFTAPMSGQNLQGLSLVYWVNKSVAHVGDVLTFTARIVNSSKESLTGLTLDTRSATDKSLDSLSSASQPARKALAGCTLHPASSMTYSFNYEVKPSDVVHGRLLVSDMRAALTSDSGVVLRSTCVAKVVITA